MSEERERYPRPARRGRDTPRRLRPALGTTRAQTTHCTLQFTSIPIQPRPHCRIAASDPIQSSSYQCLVLPLWRRITLSLTCMSVYCLILLTPAMAWRTQCSLSRAQEQEQEQVQRQLSLRLTRPAA